MKMKQKWISLLCIGLLSLTTTACNVELGNGIDEDGSDNHAETSDDGQEASDGGKVWKLVQEDKYMVAGEQERPMSFYEYEYDERGNLIKLIGAQPMGPEEGNYLIGEIKEYRYDDNGEIIWEKYTHREGGNFAYVWIEDVYDENNILIEKRRGSGTLSNPEETGDDTSVTVEKYDIEGNLIEKMTTYKAEDGSEWTSPEYKVDENGKELYQLSYYERDKIGEGFKYSYDDMGRTTECVRYFTTGTIKTTTYTYEDTDTGYLQRSYTVESRRNDDGSMTEPVFEEGADYEYDVNGYIIKYARYEREENFKQRYLYQWTERENDAEGNHIKEIDYRGDEVEYIREYTYDDNGNCIKYMRYTADGALDVWGENAYDSQGNEIKDVYLNSDGSIKSGKMYEYDQYGNVSKEIYYSNGVVSEQKEYTYASDGTLLKEVKKGGENAGTVLYHYEMDEEGNMQKDLTYNEDGSVEYGEEYLYNPDGTLQERKGYGDGEVVNRSVYSYDDGLLIKMEMMNAENELIAEENYSYDKHDNCVEMSYKGYDGTNVPQTRTVYQYEKIRIKE